MPQSMVGAGLITPGLERRLLEKASESAALAVHIELEDGVPNDRKPEAREVINRALRELDWSNKITMVRVNPYASGELEDDILGVASGQPSAILLGKCQGPEDVIYADRLLTWTERREGLEPGSIRLAAMIERARAFTHIEEVATASERLMALYIGPSDLGNELGYRRTYRGLEMETMWVRSRVALTAHANGLLAIDSPYVPYTDLDGTSEQARWSYRLGFDIKTCISPRQIGVVNEAFSPTDDEIQWAEDVLSGQQDASAEGRSVWVAHGMMLDAPHVILAGRILEQTRSRTGSSAS